MGTGIPVQLGISREKIPTAEEMLAKGPSTQDEDTIYGLILKQPSMVCLEDYCDDDCDKCYGRGKIGFNETTQEPQVCDCVHKNFRTGKWYKPKKVEARLRRESAQFGAKAGNPRESEKVAG